MEPSSEPILILGAIAAIVQVIIGALTGHLEITGISAAITAVMAAIGRQTVTPNSKVRARNR